MNFTNENNRLQSQWSYQPFRPGRPNWSNRSRFEIKETEADKSNYEPEIENEPKPQVDTEPLQEPGKKG